MKEKKVLLIGGSGYIGKELQKEADTLDFVLMSGRAVLSMNISDLKRKLNSFDVIVNLAGEPVSGRWTKRKRKEIFRSRVLLTGRLVEALNELNNSVHFINASAIGIYKSGVKADENSVERNNDFLADVVYQWENEVKKLRPGKADYTILRIGLVLGQNSKVYQTLRKLVKLNLGVIFSGGKQRISFILIDDLVAAVKFIIERKVSGVVNLTAPQSTDYYSLMTYLKDKVGARFLWNIPELIVKMAMGESASVILAGQDVYPSVLERQNFKFIGNDITSCINKIEKIESY